MTQQERATGVRSSQVRRHSLIVGIAALGLTACAGSSDSAPSTTEAEDPYRIEFSIAEQEATTDFEREALADGVISREEYDVGEALYLECLADRGIRVSAYEVEPGYNNYEVPGAAADKEMWECAEGTNGITAELYIQRLVDPDNVGFDQMMVACLRDEGLVDDDYTVEDFADTATEFVVTDDGDSEPETREIPPKDSLPFDDTDPRFEACVQNPRARTSS